MCGGGGGVKGDFFGRGVLAVAFCMYVSVYLCNNFDLGLIHHDLHLLMTTRMLGFPGDETH